MTGKAAVFTEVGKPFHFREYPLPDVAPDAMLIRVTMANICGSDLHFVRGGGPGLKGSTPRILGHEMVGVIERLGPRSRATPSGSP
ncbi:MAG: alcohol dehydrogenase catalytic domain-containing protein [candidate division NC10 bacterium]